MKNTKNSKVGKSKPFAPDTPSIFFQTRFRSRNYDPKPPYVQLEFPF